MLNRRVFRITSTGFVLFAKALILLTLSLGADLWAIDQWRRCRLELNRARLFTPDGRQAVRDYAAARANTPSELDLAIKRQVQERRFFATGGDTHLALARTFAKAYFQAPEFDAFVDMDQTSGWEHFLLQRLEQKPGAPLIAVAFVRPYEALWEFERPQFARKMGILLDRFPNLVLIVFSRDARLVSELQTSMFL